MHRTPVAYTSNDHVPGPSAEGASSRRRHRVLDFASLNVSQASKYFYGQPMNFFVLENPKVGCGGSATDFTPVDGSAIGAAPRCNICSRFVGMMPLVPQVQIDLDSWGTTWGDIAFGPGDQILVSGELKIAFGKAGLNGFERFDPVTIDKIARRNPSNNSNPPDYWLATISRSQAMLDENASGMDREGGPACSDCGLSGIIKGLRRVALRPNTWSHEDVFFARGLPGRILVSERFKTLSETKALANCSLVDADKFGFNYYL